MRRNVPHILGVAFIALVAMGCDLTAPDDRHVVDAPDPVEGNLDPWSISEGQHLAGTWKIQPQPGITQSPIRRAIFLLDGELVQETSSPPFELTLATTSWAQGPHEIIIGIIEESPNIGVIGLAGVPSVVAGANVVFDQTPPTPVTITSAEWVGDRPRLTWTQNKDLNFARYEIGRNANRLLPSDTPMSTDRVITDQDTTTFTDEAMPLDLAGLEVRYHVSVSNNAEVVASNEVIFRAGDTMDLDPVLSPVASPTQNEIFVLARRSGASDFVIAAVSPTSFQVLRQEDLGFGLFDGLDIDPSGARLYVTKWPLSELLILDSSSLDGLEVPDYTNWDAIGVAAGGDGRAYLMTEAGPVLIVDGTTGGEIGTIATSGQSGRISRNRPGTILFVATMDGYFRVDLTPTTPSITHQVGPDGPVDRILTSGDDTRLYAVSNDPFGSGHRVVVRNASDLAFVASYQAPGWIHSLAATSQFFYVGYGYDHPSSPYFLAGRVLQLDPVSLTEVKHRDFIHVPSQILVSPNDEFLLAASLQRFLRVSWLDRDSS